MFAIAFAAALAGLAATSKSSALSTDTTYSYCSLSDTDDKKSFYSGVFKASATDDFTVAFTEYVSRTYHVSGWTALCYTNGDDFKANDDERGLAFSDQLYHFKVTMTDWKPELSPQ